MIKWRYEKKKYKRKYKKNLNKENEDIKENIIDIENKLKSVNNKPVKKKD